MDKKYICTLCQKGFTRAYSLKVHCDTVHSPERETTYRCDRCSKTFLRLYNMRKHQENVHGITQISTIGNEKSISMLISKIDKLEKNNALLKSELEEKLKSELDEKLKSESDKHEEANQKIIQTIAELKTKPIANNVLQIVCVTNNDNYLDMLTDQIGNFDQAIDYIKECALSDLNGDCKLIEKIYKNRNDQMSFTTDQRKSKIYYQNEKNQIISENKDVFGRKLANNLQNSYLKGINHLIIRNLDNKLDPNKFLEEYDVMAWNNHIYSLSDADHQRKIINKLDIPIKNMM